MGMLRQFKRVPPKPFSPVPENEEKVDHRATEDSKYSIQIVWSNVLVIGIVFHVGALIGLYLAFTSASYKTLLFAYMFANFGGIGVTAGYHRLWCHRAFKAKLPLRVLLAFMSCVGAQNDIYEWCRDHRVHHKFTETNADPYTITRGFFFAHIGWLLCKKHPDVTTKGRTVNCDDLWNDPVVRFQRKYYIPMVILMCYVVPTLIPYLMWNETLLNSYFVAGMLRYCYSMHNTWLVNSAAHTFGNQPFDRYIEARENALVSFLANGEGWHNFHHVFPWDYATSELGYYFNTSKVFIDFMAFLGQAYDLRTADPDLIRRTREKKGDDSRKAYAEKELTEPPKLI